MPQTTDTATTEADATEAPEEPVATATDEAAPEATPETTTADATTETTPEPTPTPETPAGRNRRKVREGLVTSTGMEKTAVVSVTERVRHPRYGKTVQQVKKLYAHDEEETAKVGDRVRVMETRPLSRTKRWRLLEVVERAR